MRQGLLAVAIATALMGAGMPLEAQAADSWQLAQADKKEKQRFAIVTVNKKEVLRLAESGEYLPQERAEKIQERLSSVIEPDANMTFKPVQAAEVTVEMVAGMPVIRLREQNLVSVTAEDAKLNNTNQQELAQRWASSLRGALQGYKLGKGETLPENFITIATGELTMPKGGGAGQAPEKPEKPKK